MHKGALREFIRHSHDDPVHIAQLMDLSFSYTLQMDFATNAVKDLGAAVGVLHGHLVVSGEKAGALQRDGIRACGAREIRCSMWVFA